MYISSVFLVLAAFIASAKCNTTFTVPGPDVDDLINNSDYSFNPTYTVGDTIGLRWDSNWTVFDIWVASLYPVSDSSSLAWDYAGKYFQWKVTTDQAPGTLPDGEEYVFRFVISALDKANGDTKDQVWSSWFNVTTKGAEEKNELSNGAVAGITLGATLGGLLALGGLGFLAWKMFNARKELINARKNNSSVEESALDQKPPVGKSPSPSADESTKRETSEEPQTEQKASLSPISQEEPFIEPVTVAKKPESTTTSPTVIAELSSERDNAHRPPSPRRYSFDPSPIVPRKINGGELIGD